MVLPNIYDVLEELEDSRAKVYFADGKEYLLAIYSCSHVRLDDTFLADIIGGGPQAVSYQWDVEEVTKIEDEAGRILYERQKPIQSSTAQRP